jgi:tetratricopeptide (TPR) repeat protein
MAVAVASCLFSPARLRAADTNSPSPPSYEQLLEQQTATLRAVEAARSEAEATAKRNAEALEVRLRQIEQEANATRQRELEAMQAGHRFTLTLVGVFAGVGFLGLLIVTVSLVRAMNRRGLTGAAAGGLPVPAGYGPFALGAGDALLPPMGSVEQSRALFLNAVERLEKRIRELESTGTNGGSDGKHSEKPVVPVAPAMPVASDSAQAAPGALGARARVSLLLGKGQALLNLDQADRALTCFDEAAAVDSSNPEIFVKKGAALEKLGRLDDAIEQYDRAISLDGALTMAYLRKGGVFNRMERYGDALDCYEQALRTQQKSSVA